MDVLTHLRFKFAAKFYKFFFIMSKLFMSHKGIRYECEVLKSCHLSTGYNVYLIKREVKSPYSDPFVVGVRKDDVTTDYLTFPRLNRALCYYLNLLACYA